MNNPNSSNHNKESSFWDTLTGAIVKITALIVAITGLIFAVKELIKSNKSTESSTTTNPPSLTQPLTPPDETNDSVQPGSTVLYNPCPSRTDNVSSKSIKTTSSDAVKISGDTEIDSDDWTGIEFFYNIERLNGDREIQINIKWYSQEKNVDHSSADTRIMSSKTMSLYKIEGCPELVIKNIIGLELQGSKSEDFQGKVHDFIAFPDCGSLRGITVRFDSKGENDVPQQHLNAHISSFSVAIGPK